MNCSNTSSQGTSPLKNDNFCSLPDPLSLLEEEHELQRELCNVLETLADDLPNTFDKNLAGVAVSILENSMERHMKFEDEALFPLLRENISKGDIIHAALHCLEEEHERDCANLFEITEALKSAIEENCITNAEMFGYMLRGFFECLRRHVAWEDKVIIPAARMALSPSELTKLQAWIMESEHPRCYHQSMMIMRKARTAREACCECPKAQPKSNVITLATRPLGSPT